jgi:putative transposase
VQQEKQDTSPEHIGHGLYLCFLGLSLRNVARGIVFPSHCQEKPCCSLAVDSEMQTGRKTAPGKRRVSEYLMDETLTKTGSEMVWLWVAIEPKDRHVLALAISKERNMFVAERFIFGLVRAHGRHPVSTDGGTWYPQACRFLNLNHHIHSPLEKSLIERTMQCIKDRAECFDDYFPCRKAGCDLHHVKNRLNLFARMHSKRVTYA